MINFLRMLQELPHHVTISSADASSSSDSRGCLAAAMHYCYTFSVRRCEAVKPANEDEDRLSATGGQGLR